MVVRSVQGAFRSAFDCPSHWFDPTFVDDTKLVQEVTSDGVPDNRLGSPACRSCLRLQWGGDRHPTCMMV
jgi:hypothetical protein